jgi:hypothetical protein
MFVALGMFGIAVGSLGSEDGVELGTTAGLSWLAIGALSLYAGGWTAGRLCGLQRRFEGAIHGFLTWAVASVVLVVFSGSFSVALHGQAEPPIKSTFTGPPEASLHEHRMTAPNDIERDRMKNKLAEHISNDIERYASSLIDRSHASEEEKMAIQEQVAPRIKPLVDAILSPDYQDERTKMIALLTSATGMNLQAVTSEVDRWIALTALRAKERRMSKGKAKGRSWHNDGMGLDRGHARMHRPARTFAGDGRTLAGWSFLFIIMGAATAILGGLLGSGAMRRRSPGPMIASQAPPPRPKSPTPGEE